MQMKAELVPSSRDWSLDARGMDSGARGLCLVCFELQLSGCGAALEVTLEAALNQ